MPLGAEGDPRHIDRLIQTGASAAILADDISGSAVRGTAVSTGQTAGTKGG